MVKSLPEILPISPFTAEIHDEVTLPGSKSLTNRALLLAALSPTPVTLTGALFSDDTHLMAEALRALGCSVQTHEGEFTITVSDQEKMFRQTGPVKLHVGLACTTARFLTALCAAAPRGVYQLDGVEQMRKRPMAGLINSLRQLGANVRCVGEEGFFPLDIHAAGLSGGSVELDASASSQLLSALLMIAPAAAGPIKIQLVGSVRWTFVEMTRKLMTEFGIQIAPADQGRFSISPQAYKPPAVYPIEPDATAASYWQALMLIVGGSLRLPNLRLPGQGLQGDAAFAEVVRRVWTRPSGEPIEENFKEISDTFLTLAAISPLLDGPTRITGIAHTRHQETDRVAGAATELRRLGQDVIEEEDSLTITPRPLKTDQVIETYGDHRFAMSFAILGCFNLRGDGSPWLSIHHPEVCSKTFPHFFELLETVRQKSSAR